MNGKRKGLSLFPVLTVIAVFGLCGAVSAAFAADKAQPGPQPPVICGIFGGMGPEATADLYQLIVKLTPAANDQEHIPTLMFSFPQVPDRTAAIRSGDKSAIVPYLVEGVTRLEKAGASFIAIPCNTAHYFYDDMQKAVKIPIIHMIRETVEEVAAKHPNARIVGLLATSGTIATGLYEKEFKARGIAVVRPDPDVQENKVMAAVYGIKAGTDKKKAEDLLFDAGRQVEAKGAQVVVLGCTEIPLAFNPDRASVPVVNANKVLAERSIAKYRELSAAAAAAKSAAGEGAMARCRVRDIGLSIGVLPTGAQNSLTDVGGVRVGQVTLREGDDVRTGVTAILPHAGNLFQEKVPAAVYVGNGFGKLTGSTQIEELGNLETPIILTNTLSVPEAAAALVDYTLRLPGNEDVQSVNAVVGETNDGGLNDIRGRRVKAEHVREAIARADAGPVAEGCVGAGTGTVCFGFKGGIGTSSRILPAKLGGYTVGVLVQTNFGGVLQVAGAPVGLELGRYFLKGELADKPDGSCLMIVATDAPLSSRNLKRLAKRAILGLARTGGIASNGSGDYVIAFSTAREGRVAYSSEKIVLATADVGNDALSPLFLAAEEATEEAILNSLFAARDTRGRDGHFVEALPLEKVLPILVRHGLNVHPPVEAGK